MRNDLALVFGAVVPVLMSGDFLPPPVQASDPPPSQGTVLAFFGGGGSRDKSPLKKKQAEIARTTLSAMEKEAHPVLFTEQEGCKKCGKVERLLEALSLSVNGERAAALGIDKAPGTAFLDGEKKDTGIRYYGNPFSGVIPEEDFLETVREGQ